MKRSGSPQKKPSFTLRLLQPDVNCEQLINNLENESAGHACAAQIRASPFTAAIKAVAIDEVREVIQQELLVFLR